MAREQPWMNREVVNAVMTQEATRTVYIPNIDPEMSEDEISQEMRAFGDVDIVKVVRNQQNAFVHFFSIRKAMEVVEKLRRSGKYCRDGKQVGFGKVRDAKRRVLISRASTDIQDRCAFVPKTQANNVEITMRQACMAAEAEIGRAHFGNMYSPDMAKYNNPAAFNPMWSRPSPFGSSTGTGTPNANIPGLDHTFSTPKRSVFLGNIPESATHEDLCNVIRGGNLEHIRYLPAKQCAVSRPSPLPRLKLIVVCNIRRPSLCSLIPQYSPSPRRGRKRIPSESRMGNKRYKRRINTSHSKQQERYSKRLCRRDQRL
jgi:RNA recognition motif-containing protein